MISYILLGYSKDFQSQHYNNNNEAIFYSALTLLPPAHQAHKSFSETISAPWGSIYVYSLIAAISAHIGLIKRTNQLCPHRYQFTPGWREAIMVKCLAEGHAPGGRGRGSNPHSDYSAIRTQLQCTKPLDRPRHCTLFYLLFLF